jgi:predicted DNA-binding protein (MmcQ/YjbR family)
MAVSLAFVASLKRTGTALKKYAAGFPEAWEDHPWGETVYKVGKKIFVFFGTEDPENVGLTVKLPDSGEFALTFPFTSVPGYGLGKAGWVSASFAKGDEIPVDMLEDWIDESYRTVAPKKLVKVLDGG